MEDAMDSICDGLWALEIGDTLGVIPAGVMVCRQGEILGGNDQYFYTGSYVIEEGGFDANVMVSHYNDIPGSFFGKADELPFTIKGVAMESEMDLVGLLPTRSSIEYLVRLSRLREIK
jgi:hypothetical protein